MKKRPLPPMLSVVDAIDNVLSLYRRTRTQCKDIFNPNACPKGSSSCISGLKSCCRTHFPTPTEVTYPSITQTPRGKAPSPQSMDFYPYSPSPIFQFLSANPLGFEHVQVLEAASGVWKINMFFLEALFPGNIYIIYTIFSLYGGVAWLKLVQV